MSQRSYHGHVDPGGPPARRELDDLAIVKQSVGPMDNNAYLLVCRRTRAAILIDAAADAAVLRQLIDADPLRPAVRGIVTTHRHPDHWQALTELAAVTGGRVYAGAADADSLPVPVDVRLQHGDIVTVGDIRLEIIGLRGHTPGSVAIRYDAPRGSHLFTGDSLFPGGPGRTESAADFRSLMDDLQARVFDVLPDETWVYPGHGDDTTLGAERPQLPDWRSRGW